MLTIVLVLKIGSLGKQMNEFFCSFTKDSLVHGQCDQNFATLMTF